MADPAVRGSFVWHEFMTADVPTAVAYYQKVVGWKTQPFDANYLMWVGSSGPVGGIAALSDGQNAPYWLPYISTADIDATVQHAQKLGGKVVTPVTEISNAGRYAVLADPQGAIFGVHWSPKSMAPPSGAPQPGQFSWQELATTDYKAAFAFYQALFGWEKAGEHDMGTFGIYFLFGSKSQAVGGMYNKPPGMPAAWCSYAEVADARKAAKLAIKAGGKVLNGPMQVPGGSWIAQLADPQGGLHAVVSSAPMVAEVAPAAAVKKSSKKKASKKKLVKKKKPAAVVSKPVSKGKVVKKKAVKKAAKKAKKKVMRKSVAKKKVIRKKVAQKKLKQPAKRKVARKKPIARKK